MQDEQASAVHAYTFDARQQPTRVIPDRLLLCAERDPGEAVHLHNAHAAG